MNTAGGASERAAAETMPSEVLAQLRLGHLNILQGIISRLAGYSATVKNFSVTVTAALVALALDKGGAEALWVGVGAAVVFALLDAYYLSRERAFRDQYTDVAARSFADATNLGIAQPTANLFASLGSFSVWGLYLPELAVIAVLLYKT